MPDNEQSHNAGLTGGESEDWTQFYDILQRVGFEGRDSHALVRIVTDMASANIIAQLVSRMAAQNAKMDAQNAAQNAKMDALTSKFNLLLWFIGIGVALIIAISGVFVSTLLN